MENINHLPALNLPQAALKFRNANGIISVWDVWRKKYIKLTPEEWVRQHLLHALVSQYGFPSGGIAVEKQVTIGTKSFRFDGVVYNKMNQIILLAECKAPDILIGPEVIEQIQIYNYKLQAKCCVVSNGLQHLSIIYEKNTFSVLYGIPTFALLKNYF